MTIEQLNAKFGIAGQLKFIAGNGGLPMIQIESADFDSCRSGVVVSACR